MQPNRVWILLAKKNNNEASEQDLQELSALLSRQNNNDVPSEIIEEILENLASPEVEDIDKIKAKNWPVVEGFLTHESDLKKKPFYHRLIQKPQFVWSAAAVLLICFLSVLSLINYNKWFVKNTVNIEVAKGGLQKLILPDGTYVWLNSDSKIEYDKNFGVVNRSVKLIGEAYFEVVKNAGKPFFVNTGKVQIKVLGTKFNVKSYADSKTETSLIEGKIELKVLSQPNKTYILKPSDKVILSDIPETGQAQQTASGGTQLVFSSVKIPDNEVTPIEITWTKNRIVFDNEDFTALLHQLERHYDVSINLNDDAMKTWKFSGSFDAETIEEVLYALKVAHPFKYTVKDKTINIYKP